MSVSDINKVNKLSDVQIAFLADDIKDFTEFDIFHNSTFALMFEAQELGAKVFLATTNNLKIINNKVFAKFDEISLRKEINSYLKVKDSSVYSLDSFNIIFARKDPPIDENYISYLQALSMVPHYGDDSLNSESKFKPLIINKPEGILKANEKLYALNFPALTPPTLVSSDKLEILEFLEKYKELVIKPLFNKGGEGVFYLNKNDKGSVSIIEKSISDNNRVLVQRYLPQVKEGDKRIMLLNGSPIGALSRIPKAGEFRANMGLGASIKPYELSKKDLKLPVTESSPSALSPRQQGRSSCSPSSLLCPSRSSFCRACWRVCFHKSRH